MTVISPQIPDNVARWSLRLSDAPLERLEPVFRGRFLDFAANVVAGAAGPASSVVKEHTKLFPGAVPAPGGRTTAENAALAYGIAAHTLECDDTHQPSSTHPGAVIFSTALPLAVEAEATLADVARAVVSGYEVMGRLGETAGPADQYARGFHPSGTCGVFGAAACAGILLGFGEEELAAALGLAVAVSAGSMAFLQGGGWSKLLNVGHAASAGITVARLAGLGYVGPDESIDGPHGFLAGHSGGPVLGALDGPNGSDPTVIERTSVKAHGCCRYEQGPIDAILDLRARHGFGAHEIAAVRIGVLSAGWNIIAEPIDTKRRPSSVVESRFSMPFGAALAIVRGRAAPADHDVANLSDPEIQRVMDMVDCYRDPELDAQYPGKWPAIVQLRLSNGDLLEQRVDYPKGDPENPFSNDELIGKFRALAPDVASADVDSLARLLLDEDLEEVNATTVADALSGMW